MARDWVKTVRDLRRRAARTTSESEKEIAEAKVRELMKKHHLSEEDVSEAAAEKEVTQIAEGKIDDLRVELARAIAHAHHCALVGNGRALGFKGSADAVKEANIKYKGLCDIATAASIMSPVGNPPAAAREAWRICWWFGFTAAVNERLRPPRPQAPAAPADRPNPQAQAAASSSVAQATSAMQELVKEISELVDDVAAVIERLRQKAYAAGHRVGALVDLGVKTNQKLLG